MTAPARPAAAILAPERESGEPGFRTLLVEVIPALRAFARGLCGRPELADDLAQEALMKAWAARASYVPDTTSSRTTGWATAMA